MESPREMTNIEQLRLYTVAHFYLNYHHNSGGDGLTAEQKTEIYNKHKAVCGMALASALSLCNLTDDGLGAIRSAYQDIINLGYDAVEHDRFFDEL